MLHGQSAGAANAYLLASLPQAPELFSSVILQSGGGRDYETCTTAYEVWDAYAKALKCGVDDAGCISSKPVKELVAAFEKLPVLNSGFGHFPGLNVDSVLASSAGPFVDGKIVPAQPSEVGVQVPSVFGFGKSTSTPQPHTSGPNPPQRHKTAPSSPSPPSPTPSPSPPKTTPHSSPKPTAPPPPAPSPKSSPSPPSTPPAPPASPPSNTSTPSPSTPAPPVAGSTKPSPTAFRPGPTSSTTRSRTPGSLGCRRAR